MNKLSRRAQVIKGALFAYVTPRLAQDARIDFDQLVSDVTSRHFDKAMLATRLRRATAGNLARDADLEDISEFLDSAEKIPEERKMTPEEALDDLRTAIVQMDPEEHEELLELLQEVVADGDLAHWAGQERAQTPEEMGLREQGTDRRRRLGRDEPEPFPGRPRPGGRQDPLGRAQDRRRRMAADALPRGVASTATRFPNAARILVS